MNNDTDHAGAAAMTKPELDALLSDLEDEQLRLGRGSFDSVDCGISCNVAMKDADAITALVAERDTLRKEAIVRAETPNHNGYGPGSGPGDGNG